MSKSLLIMLAVMTASLGSGCAGTLYAEVPYPIKNEATGEVEIRQAKCFGIMTWGKSSGPCGNEGGEISAGLGQVLNGIVQGAAKMIPGNGGTTVVVQPSGGAATGSTPETGAETGAAPENGIAPETVIE